MKKLLALTLAMVMICSLAACGGSGGGTDGASGQNAGSGTEAAPEDAGNEEGSDGAAAGSGKDSITIACDQDYETLHPVNTSTTIETTLINQIYDTLAIDDPADPTADMIPRVAESWEVSEDGLCYTFHLRQGVKFHDGSELTAEDVGFSLDLCAESEYQGSMVDGMDHWEVVDDYTINIYTSTPYAPFLRSVVDVPIGSKAYHDSVDEETFAQSPVGCGAYRFVSHSEGDSIKLEAFDEYYGGAPAMKEVTFKVIADAAAMSIGLQAGQIDFAEIDASVLSTLEAADGVQIATADATTFAFVAMNTQVEPYNNVKFRQAVNYAIDREALVTAYAEGHGNVNSNLLTPEREGYSDSQLQYGYDPEKARALLAECGYGDGFDAGTFIVAESYKLMAQIVQSDLEKVGITCQLEILEFNAYLDRLMDGNFTMTCLQMSLEGDTQQMSMALTADYIGMANNARWSDDRVEELFAKAVETVDEEERIAIYDEIFTIVQEEAVYCVLFNPTMLFACREGLNYGELALEGDYYLKDFSWQ